MPPLRGVYLTNPQTGAAGLYVDVTAGLGLRGLSCTDWPSTSGNPSAAAYGASRSSALTALFEVRLPLAAFPPGDPRRTTPEAYCRIEGTDYVCQPLVVTVTVRTVRPLVLDTVEIGSGASEAVRVP